jgi:pseudaminic acid synthase
MMKQMEKDFDVKIGLSDHTMGNIAPVVAATLGAAVIEKHFILDKSIGGPDATFSLDETEFTEMVNAVRDAEKCIGVNDYKLTPKQISGQVFSRSLYITESLNEGDILTINNVKSVRPGFGLHPKHYENILGKKVNKNLETGDRFKLEYINEL